MSDDLWALLKTLTKRGNIPPNPDVVIDSSLDGQFAIFNVKGDLYITESINL